MQTSSSFYRAARWALAAFGFSIATITMADPPRPSHDHWRNTQYAGHYVRYDAPSHTYVETINCRPSYRFTLVSNELNTLTIFDASRNMTVRLDYSGMYLKPSGSTAFTLYQKGTFDTRTQFQHVDSRGTYSGAITKLDGCNWVEYLAGSHTANWHFVERSTTPQSVELFDASRNMFVRLDNTQMFLKTGANPYGFFKNGHW